MARNPILMAIAGLSTFIHACMTLFTAYALIHLSVILAEPVEDDDGDSTVAIVGGFIITVLVISLILEIAVLVVSIYLILGIKSVIMFTLAINLFHYISLPLQERHDFIAPWIYVTGIYTILSVMGLIRGSSGSDGSFFTKLIIIILHAAMWYPIYMYWRDLRTKPNTILPETSPLNVGFTTQTQGMVYNAVPGNWQQGQTGAIYYPPPGYNSQVQTGFSNAPESYADQIKPTVNPQQASASYPRQMATTAEGPENPPSYTKESE